MKKLLRERGADRGSEWKTAPRARRHETLEREAAAYGAGRPLAHLAGRAAPRAVVAGGRPLPASLRREHEARLGADLGDLRLHAGVEAQDIAGAYRAEAVTLGGDVFFAAGALRPDTDAGRRLVAHEVAHTVQQARGAARGQPLLQEARGPVLRPSTPEPEVRRVDGSTFVTVYFARAEFFLDAAGAEAVRRARLAISRMPPGSRVSVVGQASAEGSPEFNQALAERRRDLVLAMIGSHPDIAIGGSARVDDEDSGSVEERERRRSRSRRVDIAIVPPVLPAAPVPPIDLRIRPEYPDPRSLPIDLLLDVDLTRARQPVTLVGIWRRESRRFVDRTLRDMGVGEDVRGVLTELGLGLVESLAMSAVEEAVRGATRDRTQTRIIMGVIRSIAESELP